MEGVRRHRVKLDIMTSKQFYCLIGFSLSILTLACITGALGPAQSVDRPPSKIQGTAVDILHTPCTSDVNNLPIDEIPACWHHWFQFNKKWTQFFDWELVVRRPPAQSTFAADYTLSADVLWKGSKHTAARSTDDDWSTIARDTITRRVSCPAGKAECSSIILFRTNVVNYRSYFFQISLPEDKDHSFIDNVDFSFHYRNATFAQYELGFKVLFCILTVGVALLYFYASKGVKHVDEERKQGVVWMRGLLAGLLLFNNPLYPLTFIAPSAALVWLSTIFQISFVCLLLLFLLVEFAMLAADRADRKYDAKFYLPKILFIGVYWAIATGMYSWVVFKQEEDPLYDWFVDDDMLRAIKAVGVTMAAAYVMVLVYLIVRSSIVSVIKASSKADRFIYSTHLLVLLIAVSGVAFGIVVGVDVRQTFDFLFFHAVFNVYVYMLAYLYLPLEEIQFSELGRPDGALEEGRFGGRRGGGGGGAGGGVGGLDGDRASFSDRYPDSSPDADMFEVGSDLSGQDDALAVDVGVLALGPALDPPHSIPRDQFGASASSPVSSSRPVMALPAPPETSTAAAPPPPPPPPSSSSQDGPLDEHRRSLFDDMEEIDDRGLMEDVEAVRALSGPSPVMSSNPFDSATPTLQESAGDEAAAAAPELEVEEDAKESEVAVEADAEAEAEEVVSGLEVEEQVAETSEPAFPSIEAVDDPFSPQSASDGPAPADSPLVEPGQETEPADDLFGIGGVTSGPEGSDGDNPAPDMEEADLLFGLDAPSPAAATDDSDV